MEHRCLFQIVTSRTRTDGTVDQVALLRLCWLTLMSLINTTFALREPAAAMTAPNSTAAAPPLDGGEVLKQEPSEVLRCSFS